MNVALCSENISPLRCYKKGIVTYDSENGV